MRPRILKTLVAREGLEPSVIPVCKTGGFAARSTGLNFKPKRWGRSFERPRKT